MLPCLCWPSLSVVSVGAFVGRLCRRLCWHERVADAQSLAPHCFVASPIPSSVRTRRSVHDAPSLFVVVVVVVVPVARSIAWRRAAARPAANISTGRPKNSTSPRALDQADTRGERNKARKTGTPAVSPAVRRPETADRPTAEHTKKRMKKRDASSVAAKRPIKIF